MQKQIKADALKLCKTPFFWLHLIIPLACIVIFVAYIAFARHDANQFALIYYQMIALAYPLVAAWLTSIIAEQEVDAGQGFFLLSAPSRTSTLCSKLFYLLVCGFIACLIALLGFHGVASLVLSNYSLALTQTFSVMLVTWACVLFQYFFHLRLGLRFGRNVNFAVAAAEILVAGLMITGLGEAVWFFVPSAWGIRFVSMLATYDAFGSIVVAGMQIGIILAVLMTLAMLIALVVWFSRWEGRRAEE